MIRLADQHVGEIRTGGQVVWLTAWLASLAEAIGQDTDEWTGLWLFKWLPVIYSCAWLSHLDRCMDKSFGWLNDWTFFTCVSDWVKKWIGGRVASMWYIAVLICREVQHGDSPGLAAAFRRRANPALPAWGRRTSSQSDARAHSQSKTFSHPSFAKPGFRPKCWWKKHTWLCTDWD